MIASMKSMLPIVSFWLFALLLQQPARSEASIPEITPEVFYDGIQNNRFDAIIDVRTQGEWDLGHIVNATLIEALHLEESIPSVLMNINCNDYCRSIVVYCRSGKRSAEAIRMLLGNGFNATLVNGLGVDQWTDAGYELENSPSTIPYCSSSSTNDNIEPCPPRSIEEAAAAAAAAERTSGGCDRFINEKHLVFFSVLLTLAATYFY